jgi:hypothetical protein
MKLDYYENWKFKKKNWDITVQISEKEWQTVRLLSRSIQEM